jgi:nitrate/TMAO reductase-like tetraheme cytochrome c subunit
MFNLATLFTAIGIDLQEGNLSQAKVYFKKFRKQYLEISKMIAEWEESFPVEPVDELELALASGEQGNVINAIGNVGKVCLDCHIANMAKVQQRYHWQDFSEISITDPVTNLEKEFNKFKMSLETAFVGIGLKLEQGQLENALKYFEYFNKRFQSLKESDSIQEMIDKLGSTLKSAAPDMKLAGNLSRQIGSKSCIKCHLVHIPAAYAKSQWKKQQKP